MYVLSQWHIWSNCKNICFLIVQYLSWWFENVFPHAHVLLSGNLLFSMVFGHIWPFGCSLLVQQKLILLLIFSKIAVIAITDKPPQFVARSGSVYKILISVVSGSIFPLHCQNDMAVSNISPLPAWPVSGFPAAFHMWSWFTSVLVNASPTSVTARYPADAMRRSRQPRHSAASSPVQILLS